MVKTILFLLFTLLTLGALPCDPESTRAVAHAATSSPGKSPRIIVPADTKNQWQSVEISILDQQVSAEATYTINIGESFQVPGSTLNLKVDTFLPAFIMNGSQMTTASNEPKNPAAYVIIEEKGEQVFSGWLFSLYPDACAIQNPRYNFNLTGYNKKP